jgi:cytochrome c oxidase subunit 2
MTWLPLLPEASNFAPGTDLLIGGMLAISLAVLALVFGLMLRYATRYRASNHIARGAPEQKTWRFEIAWTAATLVAFYLLFLWGTELYLRLFTPPPDALKIYVVGKQWMWKVEHNGGQREIDALHIPTGRPIELVMTSEDVIHDFSVPAFRIKRDVLPGRYEMIWFQANESGSFQLYCTQFCGTDHSVMTGYVIAMQPVDFQHWLEDNRSSQKLAATGRQVYAHYGCGGCHDGRGTVRAPSLTVGAIAAADDQSLRDRIMHPARLRVAGYQPLMPSFSEQISEEDMVALLAYLKDRS